MVKWLFPEAAGTF